MTLTITATRRAILACLALLIPACGSPTGAGEGAVVTFAFAGHPADTLRVHVTQPATIALVEEILAGSGRSMMPVGLIRRGPGVDPRYPFHYLPESVRLAESTIELCDGAPMHTAEEVNRFIAGSTGSPDAATATWCPWGGHPIRLDPR